MPSTDSYPEKMRIVFMGTPDFALPSFHAVVESETLLGVVTQPDRPKGRKQLLSLPPIKVAAEERKIPVFQPERLRKAPELIDILTQLHPDFIVVVAFGQILPESILNIPKFYCINVHASLLPKYRGAGPIQWAIIHGERETGVTTIQMDVGMDTGPMLLKRKIRIDPDDTASRLSPKLAEAGASLLLETLAKFKARALVPQAQDPTQATLAPLIKKEEGWVDWNLSSRAIYNRWRGLSPWPGLTSYYKKERWKLTVLKVGAETGRFGKPGEILQLSKKGLEVAAEEGYTLIKRLQIAGKREMTPFEYGAGHRIETGTILRRCES